MLENMRIYIGNNYKSLQILPLPSEHRLPKAGRSQPNTSLDLLGNTHSPIMRLS